MRDLAEVKIKTLICPLCRNHDDRKPPSVFAGEICLACGKGTLMQITYTVEKEQGE